MATLALSVAGQFAGGLIGGPFGATVGRALGALAGSAIDNALFSGDQDVSTPSPFALQGSSEGGVIPKIYGWNRVAGNIIWATNLERQTTETAGAKGLNSNEDEQIVANFAVGLCEGEVVHLGRIWADGRLLETQGLNYRFYTGNHSQAVDPLLEIKQGAGNTPAYRGLCYLVFEGLPLGEFGNRIPNISVELCRVVGDLEPAIKAITVIPGATEFGYDPEPRVRIVSPGTTASENANLLSQVSDWSLSIDELQSLCPNLTHVALVLAWFGDDLRCADCKIQPRVENTTKTIKDVTWLVSGNNRSQVPVMSQFEGGPAYGGTPSDAAVLAAIADLKARGLKVTLYPFILMDIENTNTLPDPYTGLAGQSAYPWRGRITSMPAPGEVGSPDKSAAMNTQISAFVGSAAVSDFTAATDTINYTGATDWGYRRLVLHYAKLAELAGGVGAILIGSEFRGLTWLRNSTTGFPFVDELVTLASDVRTIVGAGTKISYAADWSEYSGLQPIDAPGDKLFHLDTLWASADIDAIGIDNYMPLSDWRGEGNEPDQAIASHPHQLDYLSANIAGGEGYDWYYASSAQRVSGSRTPITDGPDAEPWIWRFKDIKNWWSNSHHNRVGGARDPVATAWAPQSKPIWFTELGCGAVDKGPNQPNVFGDAKSVENAAPYFSDGTPDALAQRQFLRAHHQYWQPGSPGFDPVNNPGSNQYVGEMIDPERLYVWTWDARPYPAFPMRLDVWSDGINHKTGHWLTGRLGAMASEEFLAAAGKDYGVSFATLSAASPQIQGAQVSNIVSLRRAIESFLDATAMFTRDTPDGVSIFNSLEATNVDVHRDNFAVQDAAIISRQSPNGDEATGQLALAYMDRSSDYQAASVVAIADENPVQAGVTTNLVLDRVVARQVVETLLANKQAADQMDFNLPMSMLSLEAGDAVKVVGQGEDRFSIVDLRQGTVLRLSTQAIIENLITSTEADTKISVLQVPQISAVPEFVSAQLPGSGGDIAGSNLLLGAFANPWPGEIAIANDIDSDVVARLHKSASLGVLTTDFLSASTPVWDKANELNVTMFTGHLSSRTELETLNGVNRVAVLKNDGNWEIVGFASAELINVGQYRLSSLLRGQNKTIVAATELASGGNQVVLLDGELAFSAIANEQLATTLSLRAYSGASDLAGQSIIQPLSQKLAQPLPPVHLSARQIGVSDDISLKWIRTTQIGGDSWTGIEVPLDFSPEFYLVSIFDGTVLVRVFDSASNQVTYTAAQQIADLGAALLPFNYTVQQVSAVHGAGNVASGSFVA